MYTNTKLFNYVLDFITLRVKFLIVQNLLNHKILLKCDTHTLTNNISIIECDLHTV